MAVDSEISLHKLNSILNIIKGLTLYSAKSKVSCFNIKLAFKHV